MLFSLLIDLLPLYIVALILLTGGIHYKTRNVLEERLETAYSKRAVKEQYRSHTIFSGRFTILRGIADSLAMRWQREMVTARTPDLQELLSIHDWCMLLFPLAVGLLLGGQQIPVLLFGGLALLLVQTAVRIWLAFK